jgi:hypothetical protein
MEDSAHSVTARSTIQEERTAMPASRSAARLFGQTIHAKTLAKWILAAVIIGAGVAYLSLASHVRGVAAPIEAIRSGSLVKTIVPTSAHTAPAPRSARPPLPAFSGARFRFGFLEFEDDPDAAAE